MTFHFPIFVWRSWSVDEVDERQDGRKRKDGTPWRKSEDLSYLRGATTPRDHEGKIDMLHESQISLTITCFSRRKWTLQCLRDTYFYRPNPCNEDMLDFYKDEGSDSDSFSEDEFEPPWDPITLGNSESGLPIHNPGEYFYHCLHFRTRQVLDEFRNTQHNLEDRVSTWVCMNFRHRRHCCRRHHQHLPHQWARADHLVDENSRMPVVARVGTRAHGKHRAEAIMAPGDQRPPGPSNP